jgi:hypothetical protein
MGSRGKEWKVSLSILVLLKVALELETALTALEITG